MIHVDLALARWSSVCLSWQILLFWTERANFEANLFLCAMIVDTVLCCFMALTLAEGRDDRMVSCLVHFLSQFSTNRHNI